MRRNIAIVVAVIFLVVIVALAPFWNEKNAESQDITTKEMTVEEDIIYGQLTEEEIVDYTFELLNIFYNLYYITQDDSVDAATDSEFVMSMLTETMNDKNKLDKLALRAQALMEAEDEVVHITAMSLFFGLTALSESHQSFVNFLRSVDTDNVDLAEFRYQIALHQSNNKDAFNTIIEGTLMYPYVFVKFAEDDESENTVALSQDGQERIKNEIQRLFADIFIEDEKWHEETGNRNAVVLIVGNYRDFITSE